MSLYNNVAESLASNGVMGSIGGGIQSLASGAAGKAASALGGGTLAASAAEIGKNMAANAAMNLVNKYAPALQGDMLDLASRTAGDIMAGNLEGAGMRLLDSGLLNRLFHGMSGVATQARYWGAPTPLFGGISPAEARQIYGELRGQKLARKNLFLLEVSSPGLDVSRRFNLFATELEFAPCTISGEKRKLGGATLDSVVGGEPVELRLTTLDDQSGFIKRWFESQCAKTAAQDGTVGVPAEYAVTIRVVHAFVKRPNGIAPYESVGLFRPANMECSLSRRENAMQEVQLTFAQLDTFMAA